MTTEWELRTAARNLADAYNLLDELKWTPARQEQVRKMKPSFNSQSPSPDGDWALNLEIELMRDTPDDTIPGGLRSMACDALNHTTARAYGDESRPGVLCAHIYRNAWEICDKFPAANDLADLLRDQATYLQRIIRGKHSDTPRDEQRQTSDSIRYRLAQQGIAITADKLRQWARYGHISSEQRDDGRNTYLMSEVLAHASKTAG